MAGSLKGELGVGRLCRGSELVSLVEVAANRRALAMQYFVLVLCVKTKLLQRCRSFCRKVRACWLSEETGAGQIELTDTLAADIC